MTNELTTCNDVIVSCNVAITERKWREEPDGINDRTVDIWYNNKLVPAYFSDIRKGDFYLDINTMTLEPGRCFFAASDCRSSGHIRGVKTFIILNGAQIVQAPSAAEKTINELPSPNILLK